MALTKKDFIALADRLRSLQIIWRGIDGDFLFEAVVDEICQFCRTQNPRFDEARFRAYITGECGPSGGKPKKGAPCPM